MEKKQINYLELLEDVRLPKTPQVFELLKSFLGIR